MQAATAMQVPFFRPPVAPWQFVEQQSAADAHASPSVPQVEPLPPAGIAVQSEPKPQIPEQHCELLAQAFLAGSVPLGTHTFEEQVPPLQIREQHCASELQDSPGYEQSPPSLRQVPVAPQTAEQHWESRLQPAPASLQVAVGRTSQAWDALQKPEQQSALEVQATVSALHTVVGWVHTPPSHEFVQHSCGEVQVTFRSLQVVLFVHVPLQAVALQQSAGVWQTSPSWRHTLAAALHVWLVASQFVEQHSPLDAHAASFEVHAGFVVVVLLFLLQPVAATASAASADTSSVENLDVRMRSSAGPATMQDARWADRVTRFRHAIHVVAGASGGACRSRRRGPYP